MLMFKASLFNKKNDPVLKSLVILMGSQIRLLQVECAWRVSNPQREKRYADFLKNLTEVPQERTGWMVSVGNISFEI